MELLSQNIINNSPLLINLQKLLVAILVGTLIGLERERKKEHDEVFFAGIRTFPLVAIFGFLAAFIDSFTNNFIYIAFFASVASLISISYYLSAKVGEHWVEHGKEEPVRRQWVVFLQFHVLPLL